MRSTFKILFYLKKNNLKQKQFIIGLIEDALEQEEQPQTQRNSSSNGKNHD